MRSDYRIRYVSPSGETLNLSGGGIDASAASLPSWQLEAIEINNKVAGLTRKLPEYEIPLIVVADTPQAGIDAKNAIYNIPARDRANKTPGRLYLNEWYMTGYIKASTPDNFWQLKRAAQYVLTFVATNPKWTLETTFHAGGRTDVTDKWLNFPYDFAYDLGGTSEVDTVENGGYTDSPAKIRMYGAAVNPFVTIAGNTYQANVTLGLGDYLELDGVTSTATVYRNNGATENAFPMLQGEYVLNSGSYAFQPIPVGTSEVQWPGSYDVDVVVYEQRDEPRWS